MGSSDSKSSDAKCMPFGRNGATKLNLTLAVLGLDNAGKTSTVLALAKEPIDDLMPSVGFDSKTINLHGNSITLYDLGGGAKIRGIWKNYLAEVHGIVYVVDAADQERVKESAQEFENLCANEFVSGKPILVLANKSDIPGVLSQYEITELMNLEETVNKHKVPTNVQPTTTKDVKTLQFGMNWIYLSIAADFEDLNERVLADKHAAEERQKRERRERVERIRKLREERDATDAGENDDRTDIPAGGDPFKQLDRHLKDKEAEDSRVKPSKDKHLESKQPEVLNNNRPNTEQPNNDQHNSEQHGNEHVNESYTHEEDQIDHHIMPPISTQRKTERVPSPLPAPLGEFPRSRLPPLGGGLPPLSNGLPLRSLESITVGEEKKKKRKKKKTRVVPNFMAETAASGGEPSAAGMFAASRIDSGDEVPNGGLQPVVEEES